jgi:hypothetical protein
MKRINFPSFDDIAMTRACFEVRKEEFANYLRDRVLLSPETPKEHEENRQRFFKPEKEMGFSNWNTIIWAFLYYWYAFPVSLLLFSCFVSALLLLNLYPFVKSAVASLIG